MFLVLFFFYWFLPSALLVRFAICCSDKIYFSTLFDVNLFQFDIGGDVMTKNDKKIYFIPFGFLWNDEIAFHNIKRAEKCTRNVERIKKLSVSSPTSENMFKS